MIAPVSIAISNALQVSVAATGALAQATTMPSFITGLPDFSVLTSSTPILAPTLWSHAFAAEEQESMTPALEEEDTENTGFLEDLDFWRGQELGLSTRAYHAIDSSPFAQAGIALVATGATILAVRLARHRIASLAHRGWEGINRGREWVSQRWQQVHFRPRKNSDLTDTRSVPPVTVPSPHPSPAQGDSINPKMIPGFTIETNAAGELIELGKGGMGVVYLAHLDALPKRKFAIKLTLNGGLANNPTAQARFLREARAMQAIHHPHVIHIEKIDEIAGRPYIVLEYIDGGTMDAWTQKLWADLADATISIQEFETRIAHLFAETTEGVIAIHQAGIIHRDLKPGNILLTKDGVPKIADFGAARRMTDQSIALTELGKLIGTPYFLAPELFSVSDDQEAPWSEKSDVYAIGVMLFYVLTGRYPYWQRGDLLPTFFARVVSPDVKQPDPKTYQPALSDTMAAIVQKAMAKDPANRYQTADELKKALEDYLAAPAPAAAGTGSGSGPQLGDGDPLAEEFFRR